MFFILRAAFWLTLLAFLLPAAGYEITPKSSLAVPASVTHTTSLGSGGLQADGVARPEDDVSAGEALGLVALSAKDAMGFCNRNPEVCERSSAVASHVIHQGVYYGSRLLLWLADKARATTEPREEGQDAQKAPATPSNDSTILPAPRPRLASAA